MLSTVLAKKIFEKIKNVNTTASIETKNEDDVLPIGLWAHHAFRKTL
jgi:hypothetical protein